MKSEMFKRMDELKRSFSSLPIIVSTSLRLQSISRNRKSTLLQDGENDEKGIFVGFILEHDRLVSANDSINGLKECPQNNLTL